METDFNDAPCSSRVVDSLVRFVTAGSLWGLCSGPYDAKQAGLSGVSRASFVATAVGKSTFHCGLFGGIFALTHCGMQRYRRQNDWVNGLIAGAVGGAAFAVGTRNWKQVVGMASVFSAFAAAADYSVSNSMHLN